MSVQLQADPPIVPGSLPTDRQACEVQTTCQPPSGWRKDPWPAVIRDIGPSGLSLTLNRRFERGTGLAIELPDGNGSTSTILARIVHVATHPAGWLHGCTFVGELSDDEVRHVLEFDSKSAVGQIESCMPSVVQNVLFQAPVRPGDFLRWFVKRLDVAGEWPLPAGKDVSFRIGNLPDAPPVELKVLQCQRFGLHWFVECNLLVIPSDEVLQALIAPAGA
jgi:hypothetical protein